MGDGMARGLQDGWTLDTSADRSARAERAYTVAEIDELRQACRERWLYGTTAHVNSSRMCIRDDLYRGVEHLFRTYLLAGVTAADIYAADEQRLADEERRRPPK